MVASNPLLNIHLGGVRAKGGGRRGTMFGSWPGGKARALHALRFQFNSCHFGQVMDTPPLETPASVRTDSPTVEGPRVEGSTWVKSRGPSVLQGGDDNHSASPTSQIRT